MSKFLEICEDLRDLYMFCIIFRSASIKSRSGSDLNNIDDNELFSEFDRKGNDVMKELNSILRTRSQKNNEKDIT